MKRLPLLGALLALMACFGGDASHLEAATSWTPGASMAVARDAPATLLTNGDVLVTGGSTASGATASVESYHPATNTWSTRASMDSARTGHTATRLLDGRVLVAGDTSGEVYNPSLNTWTPTGSLSGLRFNHTAALLPSGKVILIGGQTRFMSFTIYLGSTDIYDPGTNTWTPGPAMASFRAFTHAVTLNDGRVLVAGGFSATADLAAAEIYDPTSNSWSSVTSMATARSDASVTLLSNGKVLVAGGDQILSPFNAARERGVIQSR